MIVTMDQAQAASGQNKLLWGAIALLGALVVAMGMTLVYTLGQNRAPSSAMLTELKQDRAAALPQLEANGVATSPSAGTPTIVINNQVTPEKAVRAAPARTAPPAVVTNRSQSVAQPVAAPAPPVAVAPAPVPVFVANTPAPAQQPVPPAGPVIYSGYPPQSSGVPAATLPPLVQYPTASPQPVCHGCGTVESVQAIQRNAQGSGTGAVAGGVLGAVVGNSIGKGSGRTVGTILGAIGGGFAGNAIEKQMKKETVYQVRVRMDDGSMRSIEQSSAPAVGSRINVDQLAYRAPQTGYGSNSTSAAPITASGDHRL